MNEEIAAVNPIQLRREEVAQYDSNIAVYEAILTSLPEEWPEELQQYRNPKNQHKDIDQVPAQHLDLVCQLWYADDVAHLIRTEKLERMKAAAILSVLEAQA
jgi:hypothetical protein